MISNIAVLLVPTALVLLADTDPTTNPIYTCPFKAGQIVIQQPEHSGEVTVEVHGQARRYLMDKLKLVPKDQGLPSLVFQPDVKLWQLLNDQGEAVESVACTEKPSLKTG